jgi:hypothetical protein
MGAGPSRPLITERQKIGETIQFPEKVYVLITTHGRMNVTLSSDDTISPELGKLSIYKVPDGMTLKKINATTPGLCNYISTGYEREILDFIKQTIDSEFLPKNDLIQQIELTTKSGKRIRSDEETPEERILNFFKRTDPSIEELRKILKKGETNDVTDIRNYIQTPRYFLNVYTSGTNIPNKYFSYKSNEDDPVPSIIKEIGRNNKIFDVMKALKKEITTIDNNGMQIITTYTNEKDIVDFFKNQGVKELVLIDLSCSVFSNYQGNTPTPRTTRLIRKRITSQKLGGRNKISNPKNTKKRTRTRSRKRL